MSLDNMINIFNIVCYGITIATLTMIYYPICVRFLQSCKTILEVRKFFKVLKHNIYSKAKYIDNIKAGITSLYIRALGADGVDFYPFSENYNTTQAVKSFLQKHDWINKNIDDVQGLSIEVDCNFIKNLSVLLSDYLKHYYSIIVYTENNVAYRLCFKNEEDLTQYVKNNLKFLDDKNEKT